MTTLVGVIANALPLNSKIPLVYTAITYTLGVESIDKRLLLDTIYIIKY